MRQTTERNSEPALAAGSTDKRITCGRRVICRRMSSPLKQGKVEARLLDWGGTLVRLGVSQRVRWRDGETGGSV